MTTLIKHVEKCLSLADEYKSKVTIINILNFGIILTNR